MSYRWAAVLLAALTVLQPLDAFAERSVVLVTDESCPIDSLDSLDIRKAYLGVAVSVNGYHVRPIRLVGDKQLDQVFYQSIVAMSQRSYARRALSLAIKFGTPRPVEFADLTAALHYVREGQCNIVYGWAEDLENRPGIKILRILWQGK